MTPILLDGEMVAARMRAEAADRVARLRAEGIEVGLGTILVGEDAKTLDALVRAKPEATYDYAELGRMAAAEARATASPEQ